MSEQSPIVLDTPEPPAAAAATAAAEVEELPKTKEKLEELTKAASLQYTLKNFSASADHYADAVEIQAELNGEMAPENAELLFYYGRALYKVAIAKSDVLGGKVAQEEKKKPKAPKAPKKDSAGPSNGAEKEAEKSAGVASKPYFQLTGDENWTDSEDEEEGDGEQQQEEEQDDFADAYEVFEIARVLYSKQLEALEATESADKGKGKAELTSEARAIKEKLADCHGFLVEISLENERFHDAVTDAQSAVTLQEELHPIEHENVTEAYYSLSLALEFASTSKAFEDNGEKTDAPKEDAPPQIDWDLRKEASKHTQLAVEGLEKRLKIEEAALSSDTLTAEQKKEKEAVIEDKKGLLEDLKTRINDLKADPTQQPVDSLDPSLFQGLIGGLLGADAATQKAKLAEAKSTANDISGLVKTKKKEQVPALVPATSSTADDAGSGKRKLEVEEQGANGKRAKTEEMQ
ncbi:hypothetical protein DM02DRAFT_618438 [Periconia macrospinosa]|uniref:Tetratricopeptide SHNi-TPR domain-containing protein n=1 Tax=Periconia macrospinosa TaxID=97972 RepID=A0A2V1D9E6_9PLEO|nr:hypothetical protein DM02DRAFT_618438 [Periconia macrospinosa]